MKVLTRLLLFLVLGGLCKSDAVASDRRGLVATSGAARVQLLELFSSESCSSCPPADQWVSDLKNKGDLWRHFVPVVFHVDYWNYLGWKDELSSREMTQRQIELSRLWPKPQVYTPGMVVDGREWTAWSASPHHDLPLAAKSSGISLAIYHQANGTWTVTVEGQDKKHRYRIHVAELGMGLVSKVTSGENSGKTLKHDFVILDWTGKVVDGKKSEEQFQLSPPSQKATGLAVVAWIEEESNPTPLQAVGSYL